MSYKITRKGDIFSKRFPGRKLRKNLDKSGYEIVDIGGKTKTVHRLVANKFIDNPENKPCVNHKNGIKSDNRVENLEWCTHSENRKHAYETGLLSKKGEKHHFARLTDEDILDIRRLKDKFTQTEIADIFGVRQDHISRIINYKAWSHVK